VSKNVSIFQNLSLWAIPSLFIMIQNQQKFKIQTKKVPWSFLILNACSSKSCNHPTPLTTS
jgi:hypothetical protein